MIWSIAGFEIKKRFRQLSTYVYFALFFTLAFLVVISAGGAFPGIEVVASSGEKTWINSPVVLAVLISVVSYFGMITMAGIMGNAIYQDFQSRVFPLFFTAPISKWDYLLGRFVGALLVLVFIFSSLGLGAWAGTLFPGVEPALFGPNRLEAFVHPFLIWVWPNLFFVGVIFFILAAALRRILPVYLASVVLLTAYLIATTRMDNPSNKWLASILDPFGFMALINATADWTVTERNTQLVPLEGALLWNRILWMGVSLGILIVGLARFRLEHGAESGRKKRGDSGTLGQGPLDATPIPRTPQLVFRSWPGLMGAVWLNFKETVFNLYFSVILASGIAFLAIAAQTVGSLFGTETYPVTGLMLQVLGGSFTLFVLIIITFYSGELVWRERDANIQQITDALPVPTWVPLLSKFLAMVFVVAFLMGVLMLSGMAVQASMGYFHFEPGLYLFTLFVPKMVSFSLLCVLAFFVHVVVNNKYIGHFVMILYYVASVFMGRFGWEHHLYNYGTAPGYPYSDMNGYGHFLQGVFWYDLYWAAFALLLGVASHLLWVRGTETHWAARLQSARNRLAPSLVVAGLFALVSFVGLGGFIYYNTVVLNPFSTRQQEQARAAEYEKTYAHLLDQPQPRVTDVRVKYDLDPYQRRLRMNGEMVLKNKTSQPIATVYCNLRPETTIHKLALGSVAKPSKTDAVQRFHTFDLDKPLSPGGEITLAFDLEWAGVGFRNAADDTEIVYNGTFVNSTALPIIGYLRERELSDDKPRRENGLAPRERMAEQDDMKARMNNYVSPDGDWISLDAVVGTSPDQIAIVPGYLQKEWEENGKRWFHYKTEGRILFLFSMLSGRYEVYRDTWRGKVAFGKADPVPASGGADRSAPGKGTDQDVSIEIYHHKDHTYNVKAMADGIKDSLEYFTKNFSPYQHRQARIIEFPRYASFAQSFPNTIPFSESIGFIARVDPNDPKDLDYPYYVTAHEIAHQWWAHQVMGGAVKGATMLTETFAQYSALMVMKKKFGDQYMKRFLRFELDRYLMGRGRESKKELPLAYNENQPYIHYNKGSLVMYALQDFLGEEIVNRSLAEFIRKTAYQDPPYTISREYLEVLRSMTPPDRLYLIEDLFETITLYDLKALSAEGVQLPGGGFEISLKVKCRKLRSDELGAETEVPMNDLVEIGALDKKEKPLHLEKTRVGSGETVLKFRVQDWPEKVGIDPVNKLIDRRPDDNLVPVTRKE